jgi:hypothetical protein
LLLSFEDPDAPAALWLAGLLDLVQLVFSPFKVLDIQKLVPPSLLDTLLPLNPEQGPKMPKWKSRLASRDLAYPLSFLPLRGRNKWPKVAHAHQNHILLSGSKIIAKSQLKFLKIGKKIFYLPENCKIEFG